MANAEDAPVFAPFPSLHLMYRVFSLDDTGVRGVPCLWNIPLFCYVFVAFGGGKAVLSSDRSCEVMTEVTLII